MRSLQGGTGPVGTITYRNRAFVDIPLPYLDIRGRNVEILVDGQPAHVTGTQDVPIVLDGARPDILPAGAIGQVRFFVRPTGNESDRSEEHTSELQSLMRISYAVFCLKKNTQNK